MSERDESGLERARRETAEHIRTANLSVALTAKDIRHSKMVIQRSLRLLGRAGIVGTR